MASMELTPEASSAESAAPATDPKPLSWHDVACITCMVLCFLTGGTAYACMAPFFPLEVSNVASQDYLQVIHSNTNRLSKRRSLPR